MTKNDQDGGRLLTTRSDGPVDEPGKRELRDPIAAAMELADSEDPSVQELVAFRRQPIDLKSAARQAKNLHSEEFRVSLVRESGDDVLEAVCGGVES